MLTVYCSLLKLLPETLYLKKTMLTTLIKIYFELAKNVDHDRTLTSVIIASKDLSHLPNMTIIKRLKYYEIYKRDTERLNDQMCWKSSTDRLYPMQTYHKNFNLFKKK